MVSVKTEARTSGIQAGLGLVGMFPANVRHTHNAYVRRNHTLRAGHPETSFPLPPATQLAGCGAWMWRSPILSCANMGLLNTGLT